MRKLLLLIILVWLSGCSPSKGELEIINDMNKKYSDYEFSAFPGPKDVYVKLKIKKDVVDTVELKGIYKTTMQMKKDSAGNVRSNWVYLIVYDKEEHYLFTIREY